MPAPPPVVRRRRAVPASPVALAALAALAAFGVGGALAASDAFLAGAAVLRRELVRAVPLPAAVARFAVDLSVAFWEAAGGACFLAAVFAAFLASLTDRRLMGPRTGERSMNTHPTWGTGLPPTRRPWSKSHPY